MPSIGGVFESWVPPPGFGEGTFIEAFFELPEGIGQNRVSENLEEKLAKTIC